MGLEGGAEGGNVVVGEWLLGVRAGRADVGEVGTVVLTGFRVSGHRYCGKLRNLSVL